MGGEEESGEKEELMSHKEDVEDNFIPDLIPGQKAEPDPWELANLLEKDNEDDEENLPKWKKYARLILPHVGLIILSCIYIVVGAGVFFWLEHPNELRVRKDFQDTIQMQRANLLERMWELTSEGYSQEDLRLEALKDIDNITKSLFAAFDTHYINADQLNSSNVTGGEVWTFLTSIFFTSTLLTTIGYGNLVPVTFEGRMFCICYGLFGVPLILITVADIGKFLSEHIVWLYCRYLDLKKRFRKRMRQRRKNREQSSSALNSSIEEEEKSVSGGGGEGVEDLEKFGLEDYVSIPVSLVLLILVGYIALGAVLLGNLEDWDFFSAFYFSFITMTTVGFGDIVPENQTYFLLDLLYIIIGLAITTMCIDLVGIQYIRKIHYFGRAIQDARYALVNVGGKMVHVGDLMKYASVLHKKYGLTDPKAHIIENPMAPGTFTPKEIKYIRYIDYLSSTSTSAASLHTIHSSTTADDDYTYGSGEYV